MEGGAPETPEVARAKKLTRREQRSKLEESNMNEGANKVEGSGERLATGSVRSSDQSLRLAWAITVGEGILLGGMAFGLREYWLMLPVWMRSGGAIVLGSLTVAMIVRLVRVHRRAARRREGAVDSTGFRADCI